MHRWFTRPEGRSIYPEADQPQRGREFVAELRAAYARDGAGSRAAELVEVLLGTSEDFAAVWAEHEVGRKHTKLKRLAHPEVGLLEVHCQVLYDVEQSQGLLVFTAVPGSDSYDKLALLSVVGAQRLTPGAGPAPR